MDTPKLQWSEAEVRDGVLTVQIAGDRPKAWDGMFERTVALLHGGDWDEVELESGKVRVSGLRQGDEEALHHFLEGVMQQTNASHPDVGGDEEDEDDKEGRDGESTTDESEDDADAGMTGRFRELGAD